MALFWFWNDLIPKLQRIWLEWEFSSQLTNKSNLRGREARTVSTIDTTERGRSWSKTTIVFEAGRFEALSNASPNISFFILARYSVSRGTADEFVDNTGRKKRVPVFVKRHTKSCIGATDFWRPFLSGYEGWFAKISLNSFSMETIWPRSRFVWIDCPLKNVVRESKITWWVKLYVKGYIQSPL